MTEKTRWYTFLVYPDQADSDWMEQLDATHLPYAISPLHSQDVRADGTPKPSHFHVLVRFDGPTTVGRARAVLSFAANGYVEPVRSSTGAYRYLSHQDSPDKAQYDPALVTHGNGFSVPGQEGGVSMAGTVRKLRGIGACSLSELVDALGDDDATIDFVVKHAYFCVQLLNERNATWKRK